MSLYVDASALLKVYVGEPEGESAQALLLADRGWVTARLTWIEVRRNLVRLLAGRALEAARAQFRRDWRAFTVVELTHDVCEAAAEIAETTGLRTLDALHMGAARLASEFRFLTFDGRQARAARALGWTVLGA